MLLFLKVKKKEGLTQSDIDEIDKLISAIAQRTNTTRKAILAALGKKERNTDTPKPRSVAIKYRDTAPECHNNVWSGRGLPPLWLKKYEANGVTRTNFLVKN